MILDFNKPKKIRKTDVHNNMHSSDSGIAGTYVENMSDDDKQKFKAKHIRGIDERVEIRVNLNGTQMVMKVFKKKSDDSVVGYKRHEDVQISMNGKLNLSLKDWGSVTLAMAEAKQILLKPLN